MRSFEDVFAKFGGPARYAEAIGIQPVHAQTMKQRRSIPPKYWARTVTAAATAKIDGVTLEALAEIAEARAAERESA